MNNNNNDMNHVIDFLENEIHYIDDNNNDKNEIRLLFILKGELKEMHRSKTEILTQTLTRLTSTCNKVNKGKNNKKDKKNDNVVNSITTLIYNDTILDTNNMIVSDMKTGMKIVLNENNFELKVIVDPPFIKSMDIFPRTKIMSGCVMFPIVNTLNATNVLYTWSYEKKVNELDTTFVSVCNQATYIPADDTVGSRIKLYCTPYIEVNNGERVMGRTSTMYLNGTIGKLPDSNILLVRQEYINNHNCNEMNNTRSKKELRVMSYNILAEPYALTNFAMKQMFSYCHPDFLCTQYRCQLIAKEIFLYQSDIICLQECDQKVFDNYYKPLLCTGLGHYTGTYCNKGKNSRVAEGCACFINNNSLNVLRIINVPFKNVLKSDSKLNGIYSYRPDLEDVICSKLEHVGQFIVCQSRYYPNQVIIFVNTHLFFHPAAEFIRLLQVDVMVQLLSNLREAIRLQGIDFIFECDVEEDYQACENTRIPVSKNDIVVSTMLIGDLNSRQKTSAIEYLLNGEISNSHEVWQTISSYKWGKRLEDQEEDDSEVSRNESTSDTVSFKFEEVDMPTLNHDFKFTSAAGYPQYTNYTRDFKDLLDWIFIDENIDVARILPFPTEDQLSSEVALPSSCHPSDHISIVVDLKFKI